jgi:cell division protein FtsX
MILKNSLKQIIRTPVRTGLFVLFLAAVTAFLCFGLYMWVSVNESLDQAAGAFITVGIIEYSQPQSSILSLTDSEAIINSPYVEHFDHREWLAVYGEGLKPTTPSYSSHGGGIMVFEPLEETSGKSAPINVLEVLVSGTRWSNKLSRINNPGCSLEPGKQYIAAGWYDEETDEFQPAGMLKFGPIAEIPAGNLEEFLVGSGRPWARLLETFKRSSDALTVLTTNDIDTIYAFHQGDAVLAKGRSFTQEEYEQRARVCLISVTFADSNNLQLGDRIDLSFYESFGIGWRNDTGVLADFGCFSESFAQESYEIIGMYTLPMVTRADWYQIDKDTIIMPLDSSISTPKSVMNNLVSCRLTNGTAEAFLADMEAANIPGITVTVYDQGYSQVSTALAGMRKTALILMAICLGTGLILSILFAFLYVGRQKRSIAIMYSLGANRRRALSFVIATVCSVAILAVFLGGLAGYALSDTALNAVYQRMTEDDSVDTAYSTVAAGSEIQYQVTIPKGVALPAAAAGTILLLTLALSAVFAVSVLRAEPLQVLAQKED